MSAVVTILSAAEAQRLTQRIKLTASSVREGLFKLRNLVDEAKHSNVWQILGYASWTAYLADTLSEEPMRLAREERQELVAYLSGEGMTTRTIAPIVGAGVMTVQDDITRVRNRTPEQGKQPKMPVSDVRSALGDEVADAYERVDWDISKPEPRKVTGRDGKTYSVPATSTPKRRSIVDDAFTANRDLFRAIERVRDITRDDRYTRNKADILAALQPSVDLANEILSGL